MNRIRVGPHDLEYASWGPSGGPTLVLLHEGLGSVAMWRDFPEKLARACGLPAFAYSRSNYGTSAATAALPRPVRYMHDEALLLPGVLEAAGISDPILVGHSDGASISILYAADHPVRGLILEAPHVFGEEVSFASIARAKEAYEKGGLRERLAKYHQNVDAAFYGWNGPWLDPEFRKWDLTDQLPRISAPILVVQGLADEYGTSAQVEAIRRGAGGKVDAALLEGCGHSPHREKPEETLAAMQAFVRSVA
ncbi:MAG: alpha/beta hydrolase [Deltaproteobacteria bacterium]|nr:MAG: alpha/beta hydrolase [Deltaproteobacteria bacterium]TMB38251.1 MAG: alpha/beta hydrolase [Deltaproteobacteria bacterium]